MLAGNGCWSRDGLGFCVGAERAGPRSLIPDPGVSSKNKMAVGGSDNSPS